MVDYAVAYTLKVAYGAGAGDIYPTVYKYPWLIKKKGGLLKFATDHLLSYVSLRDRTLGKMPLYFRNAP